MTIQAATPPKVRLMSTGSEILQGLYADSNAQRLSQMLLQSGFRVIGHMAAPDSRAILRRAFEFSLEDGDLLVVTGGLGPTEDDLTRHVAAEVMGLKLVPDAKAEKMLHDHFTLRGMAMPEANLIQAKLPEGSIPLYNHWGTAAGFLVRPREGRAGLMALPGPPNECLPMMREALAGSLLEAFPALPIRLSWALHLAMTPESMLNQALRDLITSDDPATEVSILANRGHVQLRVTSTAGTRVQAETQLHRVADDIRNRIGASLIFHEGASDGDLPSAVVEQLTERRATVAVAESCTGGWIGKSLTDVSGSSAVVLGGVIAYANEVKRDHLMVSQELLDEDGAVSESVARAMAEGVRSRFGSDWALATTGIAGPGGGTEAKPVGTVWFAVAGPEGTIARERRFPGVREAVREFSVNQGLELLRRAMNGIDLDAMLLPSSG